MIPQRHANRYSYDTGRPVTTATLDALQSLVGDSAWQTLLAFSIGYSTHEGLRSPRRPVDEVVKP